MKVTPEFDGPPGGRFLARLVIDGEGEPIVAQDVRNLRFTALLGRENYPDAEQNMDARIEVPTGRPYGPEFYDQVERVWKALVASGDYRPGQTIADASGVPVSRVHAWIKRMRLAGRLPSGKAGHVI